MFDLSALDGVFDLAVAQRAFEGDELAFLESLCEFRGIAPDVAAMPFGAGLVLAFVVLPCLVGRDVEDAHGCSERVGFCVLTEAADEGGFVNTVFGSGILVCPLLCGTVLPAGSAVADLLPR